MNQDLVISAIEAFAKEYNNPKYFVTDPIVFPKHFYYLYNREKDKVTLPYCDSYKVTLQDIEIAAIIAAHLAWGRREMIVRDITRAMDEMNWKPYDYIKAKRYRDDSTSLHRTIKWSEFAKICQNLYDYYSSNESIEPLTPDEIRVKIYGQKSDLKMANKKIHMMRRWMVRKDGIVDLGIWKSISEKELIIPLDVHVHNCALTMGITKRKSADYRTALEITEFLKRVFPEDPCKGDFALFGYSITSKKK